jgi:hypothetical protein
MAPLRSAFLCTIGFNKVGMCQSEQLETQINVVETEDIIWDIYSKTWL